MKKLIELTPEWVLDKISDGMYANGKGVMGVLAHSSQNINWISLAIDTLQIPFKVSHHGYLNDPKIIYEFKIEDIKKDCPDIYEYMKFMNKCNPELSRIKKLLNEESIF